MSEKPAAMEFSPDARLLSVTRQAWYVIGSDVLGPMGHELVPFATREDAEAYLHDHAAKRILPFGDVTQELLGDLDAGCF